MPLKPAVTASGAAWPMRTTPTQGQLLIRSRAEASIARKKRYRRVIGIGLFAAGIAMAFIGAPLEVSFALWGFGALSWFILKRV
jgi:hypothetical protein